MDFVAARIVDSARTDTLRHLRRHCSRDAELGSSGCSQFDDGEMFAAGSEADVKIESSSASTVNVGLRSRTRRPSRPTSSRLEPRRTTTGRLSEVDFIGSSAVQPRVWPIPVVPGDEERQLLAKRVSAARDEYPSRALVLHRENEPFDHGDTAVLPHRTESLTDAFATTPLSESNRDELLAVIGDQVLRVGSGLPNHTTEKHGDGRGRRTLVEHGDPHDATREVIHRHGDPPAERPSLR